MQSFALWLSLILVLLFIFINQGFAIKFEEFLNSPILVTILIIAVTAILFVLVHNSLLSHKKKQFVHKK